MLTDVQVCSKALVRLGDDPITSFSERSSGPVCQELFPEVKLRVLTSGPWRFNTLKSAELVRLTDTSDPGNPQFVPPTEYKYIYALPSNMLTGLPRTVWNSPFNQGNSNQFTNFDIFETFAATVTAGIIDVGGSGYVVGDKIFPTAGSFSVAAQFNVDSVSGGAVTAVTLEDGGTYSVEPGATSATTTNGSGIGATLTGIVSATITNSGIYTSAEQILIDYAVNPDTENFPPHVTTLYIYAMCAELALPITDQQKTSEFWEIKAWGAPEERGKGGYFRAAQRIDSQGHPSQSIKNYPLTAVRHGGI